VKSVPTAPPAERADPDKIKAILFDLDGTLIDTDDATIATLARGLQLLAPGRDVHRLARRIVMGLESPANAFLTLLDILSLDDNMFSLSDGLHRMLGHRTAANFRPVPGVIRALPRLRERYRLAVVTTRGRGDAGVFLAEYNLLGHFAVVTTHESTFRLKPHPAPVLLTASQLGLTPESCLMVGDTWVDIKSAVNAGAPAAGVLCGFGAREELEEAGASMILDHPAQLLQWSGA
jgi:HAD superfamily hydrolase (TIGR01509 family)